MRQLEITWQRLVADGGRTCDRCDATGHELQRAITTLGEVLRPLGIEPVLETREISEVTFRLDPSLSNQIHLNGHLLEDWLDAHTGTSPCCSVCGDAHCRTLESGTKSFETIPERLVVRAGLVAAAAMLE